MKNLKLLLLLSCVASPLPAQAHQVFSTGRHSDWAMPSAITCETVRNYVNLVGLAQARAIARANGMTDDQERRARRCLARDG